MANHGAVSYGSSLLDAFQKMETLEHLAQVALAARQLGSAQPLSSQQVQDLQLAKAKYVENARAARNTEPSGKIGTKHPIDKELFPCPFT